MLTKAQKIKDTDKSPTKKTTAGNNIDDKVE